MPRDRFDLTADALAASARRVQSLALFQTWSRGVLRGVLPHQALLCGQLVRHAGGYTALHRCSVDLPDTYLEPLERPGSNLSTPMLERLLQAPEKPHFFDPVRDIAWGCTHPGWFQNYLRVGWRNSLVMGHTQGEGDAQVLTAATFYNVAPEAEPIAPGLLRAVMPPLHTALCSWYEASQARERSAMPELTQAEAAIAHWLKQGLSNKEIAKALGKSDHTVKHQISTMMRKFEVSSRSELVSGFGGL
jgi:DNA-binding CsgD family transcriptional regulator